MATMLFFRGTIFEDLVGVEDLVLVNSGDLFGE
jgi:hypothetical protein